MPLGIESILMIFDNFDGRCDMGAHQSCHLSSVECQIKLSPFSIFLMHLGCTSGNHAHIQLTLFKISLISKLVAIHEQDQSVVYQ